MLIQWLQLRLLKLLGWGELADAIEKDFKMPNSDQDLRFHDK